MKAETLFLRGSVTWIPMCEVIVKQGIKREPEKLMAENFLGHRIYYSDISNLLIILGRCFIIKSNKWRITVSNSVPPQASHQIKQVFRGAGRQSWDPVCSVPIPLLYLTLHCVCIFLNKSLSVNKGRPSKVQAWNRAFCRWKTHNSL